MRIGKREARILAWAASQMEDDLMDPEFAKQNGWSRDDVQAFERGLQKLRQIGREEVKA